MTIQKLFEKNFEDGSLLILNPSNTHWAILEKEELEQYEQIKRGYINNLYSSLIKEKILFDLNHPIKRLDRRGSGENLLCLFHMTGKCNLSCDYCYEKNTKNDDSFTQKLGFYLVDYLLKSRFKKISLVFHGGEPLLKFDLIKEIVNYAKLKDESKRFLYSIQTNGTLITKQVVDFCKINNISIGISLDGPKGVHDYFRHNKLGKGSLNEILRSIKLLRENNKSFGVLSVVSKLHIGREKELLDFFVSNGIHSFRLNPLVLAKGFEMDKYSLTPNEYFEIVCKVFEGVLEYKKDGIKLRFLDIIDLMTNIFTDDNGFRCLRNDCGAGFNFLAVNPNGDVFPCGEFVNISEFKQGNIFKNSVKELQNSAVSQKFRKRVVENRKECSNCEFRNICGGGCPGKSFFRYGSINAQNFMCEYYKKIIPYLMFKYKQDPSIVDMIKRRGNANECS